MSPVRNPDLLANKNKRKLKSVARAWHCLPSRPPPQRRGRWTSRVLCAARGSPSSAVCRAQVEKRRRARPGGWGRSEQRGSMVRARARMARTGTRMARRLVLVSACLRVCAGGARAICCPGPFSASPGRRAAWLLTMSVALSLSLSSSAAAAPRPRPRSLSPASPSSWRARRAAGRTRAARAAAAARSATARRRASAARGRATRRRARRPRRRCWPAARCWWR